MSIVKKDYNFPTAEELEVLHHRAIEMRNEALRESFKALRRSIVNSVHSALGKRVTDRHQGA